jgi:hypothetical protein
MATPTIIGAELRLRLEGYRSWPSLPFLTSRCASGRGPPSCFWCFWAADVAAAVQYMKMDWRSVLLIGGENLVTLGRNLAAEPQGCELIVGDISSAVASVDAGEQARSVTTCVAGRRFISRAVGGASPNRDADRARRARPTPRWPRSARPQPHRQALLKARRPACAPPRGGRSCRSAV